MALNLSKSYTPSSTQVASSASYNTDLAALFNAFSGLEAQTSTLGGLTITPTANSTTTFKVTNAAGTGILTVDTTNGNTIIPGVVYSSTASGSLGISENTAQSITLASGGSYLLVANLYGSSTDVRVVYVVNSPRTPNVNVAFAALLSSDYEQGSISAATQDGGNQYALNTSSNYIIKVTFTAGTATATWTYNLLRII